MKENWYELVYENDENNEANCGPTVLYTSRKGLATLITQLQNIYDDEKIGRYDIQIEEDEEHYLPFSHIEVAEKPPEEKDESSWPWQLVVLAIASITLLAIYGLVQIIINIVT